MEGLQISFLKDKVALITGAGPVTLNNGKSGLIGYAITAAYSKEGPAWSSLVETKSS